MKKSTNIEGLRTEPSLLKSVWIFTCGLQLVREHSFVFFFLFFFSLVYTWFSGKTRLKYEVSERKAKKEADQATTFEWISLKFNTRPSTNLKKNTVLCHAVCCIKDLRSTCVFLTPLIFPLKIPSNIQQLTTCLHNCASTEPFWNTPTLIISPKIFVIVLLTRLSMSIC